MATENTVLCHGCFDILHAGHLAYFKEAKRHGEKLIVTLTSDRYVNKGPGRPHFSQDVRAEMLRAIRIIDHVEIIDDPTAMPAIHKFKPNVYFKGQDYADKSKDVTGGIIEEEKTVEQYGGKLVFSNSALMSSSHILNRFFIERTSQQTDVIEQVRELGGIDKIRQIMTDIEKLDVLVLGEPILDIYVFVEPQNISSKYPCVSAKYIEDETYMGGSFAIENHIRSFCTVKRPEYRSEYVRKTRFISKDKHQRIFEMTKHVDGPMYCGPFSHDHDVTILADFGHGLFSEALLQECMGLKNFVSLNVQTNSSNYGFNTFQRHKRWDYLVLDKKEIQLAYHDNKTRTLQLAESTAIDYRRKVSVTLGSNGSIYYGKLNEHGIPEEFDSPAFADQVVDATGAGDAYFAITSLLVKVDAHPQIIPFIGNVFAGLKTKIIGNKSAVSKAQLMKALEALLK